MNLQQFGSGMNVKDDGMLTQQSIPSPPCSIPDQQATALYNPQIMVGIPSPSIGYNALLIDTVCTLKHENYSLTEHLHRH